ncbi:MAG: 4-hydroxy-tetrahydrodipicolinate synthase [Alphaproteobacteria bacterium]|nr:4-hydroxy-tetrahydrodipicolinate synthase [Alphaproteobacteria bacterium]
MNTPRFHGSITALITPFVDGKVDEKNFQKLVQWQIDQGTHGLVPCGTTGESPTLTHEENHRVTELCIEVAKGKVPVIAGCGSNSTAEAISLTRHAEKAGADAALHVVPYYNKPTQEGMYAHYKAIHDATNLPIFIYNIPGRSVVNMSVETMARLAELPRIIGTKDSSGDITRPSRIRALCKNEFRQLTGDDPFTLPFLAMGGHGCISVTSNVAPALCAQLYNAWSKGDLATAEKINDRLMPLHDALFYETSPGPVKYAAALLGLCRYEFRLPMVPIAKGSERRVEAALQKLGLLAADAVIKPAVGA